MIVTAGARRFLRYLSDSFSRPLSPNLDDPATPCPFLPSQRQTDQATRKMAPITTTNNNNTATVATPGDVGSPIKPSAPTPDLSYLPAFNVAGGRPTERRGLRGSFTRGVRIMSGGPAREVPLHVEAVDHGKVLFVSSTLKPDLSGEARTNAVGGRPTERLGSSRFTPGAKTFRGGAPRHVPLEAGTVDPGTVLFVSSVHRPDLSYSARNNAVGGRPNERLGSRGSFTPGVRCLRGGKPRDVPLARRRDPGTVLYESSTPVQPDLSAIVEEETNVAGGRADERRGKRGSFNHGIVEGKGGPLQLQAASALEELWLDIGQAENKYRRCGPSHFVAGVSILSGGMPVY